MSILSEAVLIFLVLIGAITSTSFIGYIFLIAYLMNTGDLE